jgi:hypothetical protein
VRCETPCVTASRLKSSSQRSKLAPLWQAARWARAGVVASSAISVAQATVVLLERGNCLHLDQKRLLNQPVDHQ